MRRFIGVNREKRVGTKGKKEEEEGLLAMSAEQRPKSHQDCSKLP